jgi:CBS domain-containing protein
MDQFRTLHHHRLGRAATLARRADAADHAVSLSSPALEVMTDLTAIDAVRIGPNVPIDAALERMKVGGVRLLFVTGQGDDLLGVITSRDIEGERPVQFMHDAGVSRAEVLVRDIMTPRDQLEAMLRADVAEARVGDVVATLRRIGRQHALVVDAADGAQRVSGLFSTSRIGRQLGQSLEVGETAQTFAEIGAALGR